ncbi:TPA: winged helix-turn-helix transcriptional regulator [Candidatus Woesearchaeota archaeon]|nr:winged helix-turn-helix transcriptional regulator [Candidatus Woesearchaeota archaeon]HIH43180.1 winged helix-turn-helix transcriptional regulator [Candidatus Woesearchaeota archaeon]
MVIITQRITIVKIRRPAKNVNDELQWFGNSIGLFNMRDKDKSMFRIFIELLKSTRAKQYLTSDEIADKLQLSRGTVIHHVNKLMAAGLVVNERNRYLLRVDNLEELVDELRTDIARTMDDLKKVAENIDKMLGL